MCMWVYLHAGNGSGLVGKHDDPLCDALSAAVQVGLLADQVVVPAAHEVTREHDWHLIRPAFQEHG